MRNTVLTRDGTFHGNTVIWCILARIFISAFFMFYTTSTSKGRIGSKIQPCNSGLCK